MIVSVPATLTLAQGGGNAAKSSVVGGKARHLRQLVDAGFNVPFWSVVTTAAFDEMLSEIDAAATNDDPASRRQQVLHHELSDAVRSAIETAYQEVVAGAASMKVAIRSSSTSEDLGGASFAGQYDTFLDVDGPEDVVDAVRHCWASTWSDQVTRYRSRVEGSDVPRMAVIIQRMVDAASAGVMHTVNPMTGSRRATVIEATSGLGEAVVSGTIVPDHYELEGEELPHYGCLAPAQLDQLRRVGRAVAGAFGEPQDVEWAFDQTGELFLTQTRPITTLFPCPIDEHDPNRVFWSVNVYQGLTQPFTPLGADLIVQRQRGMENYLAGIGFDPDIIEVDGWLYWDVTSGVTDPRKRERMAAFMNRIAAPSGDLIEDLVTSRRIRQSVAPTGVAPTARRRRWRELVPILLFPSIARYLARRRSNAYVDRLIPGCSGTARERLAYVKDRYVAVCRIEADIPRAANTAGGVAQQIATELLAGYATEGEIALAFKGIPHNPTTEMDLDLWRAATHIADHPASMQAVLSHPTNGLSRDYHEGQLPDVIHDEVTAHLAEYGCRAAGEIDVGVARWSDDPAPVFAALSNYVRAIGDGADARRDFALARAQARRTVRRLAAGIPRRYVLRRAAVVWILTASRHLKGLRELPKFCLMRGFAHLRRQLLTIGQALVSADLLVHADDIVFLHLDEIDDALGGADLRAVVADRRALRVQELARPHVPAVTLSDGSIARLTRSTEPNDGVLRGIGAASGVVTGLARVITDPLHAEINRGEILVCPSTDPGWTPLFLTAAALVTETGGMISHGTTVAREYGIPAAVGVPDAINRIANGQVITVDGDRGTVTLATRS